MNDFSIETLRKTNIGALRILASKIGVKSPTTMKKEDLINQIISKQNEREDTTVLRFASPPSNSVKGFLLDSFAVTTSLLQEIDRGSQRHYKVMDGEACQGLLDIYGEDDGVLRVGGLYCSKDDIYVSASMIKRFSLRRGDLIDGMARKYDGYPFRVLYEVFNINGCKVKERKDYLNEVGEYPKVRFNFANSENDLFRQVDLFAPLGKGQRALVAGEEIACREFVIDIANEINRKHDGVVTFVATYENIEDIELYKDRLSSVVATPMDMHISQQIVAFELSVMRALRYAEVFQHSVIVISDLYKLISAYNDFGSLSHGELEPNGIVRLKQMLSLSRSIKGCGSVTIIANGATLYRVDRDLFNELSELFNSITIVNSDGVCRNSVVKRVEEMLLPDHVKAIELLKAMPVGECEEYFHSVVAKSALTDSAIKKILRKLA